jgi:hypothetical protein
VLLGDNRGVFGFSGVLRRLYDSVRTLYGVALGADGEGVLGCLDDLDSLSRFQLPWPTSTSYLLLLLLGQPCCVSLGFSVLFLTLLALQAPANRCNVSDSQLTTFAVRPPYPH